MSWKRPFEQQWPEPDVDLRQRFGICISPLTSREIVMYAALYVLTFVLVVGLFEWIR